MVVVSAVLNEVGRVCIYELSKVLGGCGETQIRYLYYGVSISLPYYQMCDHSRTSIYTELTNFHEHCWLDCPVPTPSRLIVDQAK